jgi:hypothetical protein
MLVRLSGSVMLVNELQPEKAKDPMLVRLSGSVMLVNELHISYAYCAY